MFMRIGWRKLILSLVFLCLLFSLCSSRISSYIINNNVKAETIDDGPLGEKIVDIAQGANGYSYYALTENHQVYAWGGNDSGQLGIGNTISQKIPKKVLSAEGEGDYYLSNIVKVVAAGSAVETAIENGPGVAALTKSGEVYVWGNNNKHILGLNSTNNNLRPKKLDLHFSVRDIFMGHHLTLLLSTEGEIYVAGTDYYNALGLGSLTVATEFTKMKLEDGSDLPKIIDMCATSLNTFLLASDGSVYSTGHYQTNGSGIASHNNYPKKVKISDTEFLENAQRFILAAHSSTMLVETSDGIYMNQDLMNNKNLFSRLDEFTYLTDEYNAINNMYTTDSRFTHSSFTTKDHHAYNIIGFDNTGFHAGKTYTVSPYESGPITTTYDRALKILKGSYNPGLLLSINGGVFYNGAKIGFGDILISGKKTNGTAYASKEKYNNTITLEIETTGESIDSIHYKVKNLSTSEVSNPQAATNKITIPVEENILSNILYEFYVEGKEEETKTSFIVDLYKRTPTLDLKNEGIYPEGKKITLGYNGFEQNIITGKIIRDGVETEYLSGSEIIDIGKYTLDIVDLYGNTNTYTFTITDAPIAEDVLFTPINPEGLIYGNDCTKAGNIIGTLSLKYPTGKPIYEIDTISLDDSVTSQFEIVNKIQLKVIGNDLNAGTYTIPVTGTDTNGMDFSGSFTITIDRAEQTLDWKDEIKAYQTSGITKDTELTLQVKDVLDDAEITYGLKESTTCTSVVPTTGVVNVTCVPDSKEISLTATAKATTNYDTKTINITLPFTKEYIPLTVTATSENKAYTSGTWAKHDVTFTITGGLSQDDLEGYEYAVTDGSSPNNNTNWDAMSTNILALTNSMKDKTYWFRVVPYDPSGTFSTGIKVNLDVDVPSIPTLNVEEINQAKVANFINMLSFGSWMNKQAEVTIVSTDQTSGIDHYEYIETIDGVEAQPKTSSGTITYKDEVELTIKARACDKAGNCSAYTNAEELKIDRKAPTITGVKDQSEYKQYYTPRFVTVTDPVSGLKQATYKKDNTPAGTLTDNVETPIKGEGSYEIYAIDEAGNEITITFKILKLPNIETEIDGSDESREIIDQIIKEYEEVKDKIDQNEKDNYEEWIKDAEEKWDSLRTKVIEDNETTSKVEGQGDTTFDPKTELIVEEIPKDQVPVLPRNAIKTYDVYLKKGNTIIQPDGSVKVYLPYTEEEPPIVYEIGDDGTITELKATQEGEYVTFITDTLKKYAISNEKQKENKPDVCVVGPDHKADSSDDVCGSDGSVKNDDGSVTVPEGGKVIFPDKEIEAPDGAVINPDGSVDFPDGTHFDPDGNETTKPDPDPKPDDKNDQICTAGPDGKLGSDDDVCGEGNGDEGVPPVKEPDGSVTVPDGGSVIFPDGSEVELPDGGIIKPDGSVVLPDGTEYNPDGTKKDPDDTNKKECKLEGKDINVDTDGDGIPDVNVDIDGDCKADLNIDVSNTKGELKPDRIPDLNIDTNGDGKPDINIDVDGDGIADLNIMLKLDTWKPDLNGKVNGFAYDTMGGLEPDLNVDDDGDGKPDRNIDTDGDGLPDVNVDDDWFIKRGIKNPKDSTTVKGTYDKATGGASTGDSSKWTIWWIALILTSITMLYSVVKKRKQH